MNEIIIKMIKEYEDDSLFFGEVDEKSIEIAENALDVKFPKEYREFIKAYDSGGIGGVDLEGVEGDEASVVKATERYRKLSLEKSIIVVQDCGEFIHCIDTLKKDSVVYSWSPIHKELNKRYNSFTDFVINEFQEAIDNL